MFIKMELRYQEISSPCVAKLPVASYCLTDFSQAQKNVTVLCYNIKKDSKG